MCISPYCGENQTPVKVPPAGMGPTRMLCLAAPPQPCTAGAQARAMTTAADKRIAGRIRGRPPAGTIDERPPVQQCLGGRRREIRVTIGAVAQVNPLTREVLIKLVYYGPGLGGKTTTLQKVHAASPAETRGKIVSLATPVDRTL